MSAILRDAQPSASTLRAGLPEPLARAIDRCLAKDPGERPPTTREVAAELRSADAERIAPAATARLGNR